MIIHVRKGNGRKDRYLILFDRFSNFFASAGRAPGP
jgi:hypothetical protein